MTAALFCFLMVVSTLSILLVEIFTFFDLLLPIFQLTFIGHLFDASTIIYV